jgi:protein FAM50
MDSQVEGHRRKQLEKARQKIYEESEKEKQRIAKVKTTKVLKFDVLTLFFLKQY